MQTVILISSIILNFILAMLLFFKSALNDILKEWWLDKRTIKRENRDRLIELRSRLVKLSGLSPLLLIQSAIHQYEKDPYMKEKFKSQWNSTLKAWGEENEYISKNEILFPNDIRILLREFQEKFAKATVEVITSLIYKERMLELTQEVSSSVSQIIEKVDAYLL